MNTDNYLTVVHEEGVVLSMEANEVAHQHLWNACRVLSQALSPLIFFSTTPDIQMKKLRFSLPKVTWFQRSKVPMP